jgi:hypothetical protein
LANTEVAQQAAYGNQLGCKSEKQIGMFSQMLIGATSIALRAIFFYIDFANTAAYRFMYYERCEDFDQETARRSTFSQ